MIQQQKEVAKEADTVQGSMSDIMTPPPDVIIEHFIPAMREIAEETGDGFVFLVSGDWGLVWWRVKGGYR